MTLSEFKAWFEGFTENIDGTPNEKQFKKIKAKVSEITGTPMTQTVFVERYRDWVPYHYRHPYVSYSAGSAATGMGVSNYNSVPLKSVSAEWDSHAALYEAGKAEYREAIQ